MSIVSALEGHTPLLTVQTKELLPRPNPVTPLLALEGVVEDPVPLRSVQVPEPTLGLVAAKVLTSLHIV